MKQVVLRARPIGAPKESDFAVETAPRPEPAPGEVLLRTIWLSLDPLIRFALDEKALTGPNHTKLGEAVYGGAVSQIVASSVEGFAAGDYVEGRTGWREYAAVDPKKTPLRKIDPSVAPLSTALGVLGMPGQTAHACVIEIGRVKAGETLVVSAAGGAVGSLAGQIGKILGARVVGIAGGAEKCAAVEALGFDACVDYKTADYAERLRGACPDGIDCYIENVGGAVTSAVLPLMKYRGRVPICGFISYYGHGFEGPGPDRLPWFMRMVMSKGLEVRGFGGILAAGASALEEMAGWVREGKLRYPEAISDGLETAPAAFAATFASNAKLGKVLVRVAPD